MARPVYSTQLLCVSPALTHNFVTCPSGVVMVVRDIDAREESGSFPTTAIYLSPAGGTFWATQRTNATDLGFYQWRGRQVLIGGQHIDVHVLSGTWSVWISGYLLTVT